MPIPLIRLRPSGLETQGFVGRRQEKTLKQKGNEMPPYVSGWVNYLVDGQRRRVKIHLYPQFETGYGLHPAGQGFLVPDNPAWQMSDG